MRSALLPALLLLLAIACLVAGTVAACDVLAFDWSTTSSSVAPARDVVVALP